MENPPPPFSRTPCGCARQMDAPVAAVCSCAAVVPQPDPAASPCTYSDNAVRIFEGSYGCENSIIYVMVTAPPLFSAPRVRAWASVSGSGLGLRFGVWPLGQRVRSGSAGLSNFSRWLQRHAKNPHFADGILFLLHLPPAIQTLTIVCLSFGSLNRYFAYFAPDPQ